MMSRGRPPWMGQNRQAWVISVLLHTGFLFLFVLGVLMDALRRKPPEHVFELVAAASPESAARPDSQVEIAETDPFEFPELAPIERLPPLELPPRQPPPAPRETPPPRAEPTPAPAPPPPQRISAAEFRDRFGQPRERRSVPRREFEIPQIDTSRIRESLQNLVVSTPREQVGDMSRQDQDALGAYIRSLRSRINAAWEKPDQYTGSLREIVVTFDVAPDGRISGARLERGDPNDPFARSVLNAFHRAVPVGPTPSGNAYTFRMPFRIVDR